MIIPWKVIRDNC